MRNAIEWVTLSDSHYVNKQERMQEILQEQVRNVVFGRRSKASGQ